MNFRDWQSLTPPAAAREIHTRIRTLSPNQQRAVLASVVPESELAARFAASPANDLLGGVPYFAKDLFDLAGAPTFAGSTFLPEVRPPAERDSAFVRGLRDV